MSLWLEENPHKREVEEENRAATSVDELNCRWFGLDAALRQSMHHLNGHSYEAIMRADLRVLAVSGFIPERGYKKLSAFRDAVEVMKDMERLVR